jgi:hypothetical protein
MFDILREWFASEEFHGCAFLNAAGEIASADDPIRIVAREHKARLLAFVRTQCDAYAEDGGMAARHVARLSRQWLVLIDGAIAVALVSGQPDAALDARAAAAALLDSEAPERERDAQHPVKPSVSPSTRTRRPSRRTRTATD